MTFEFFVLLFSYQGPVGQPWSILSPWSLSTKTICEQASKQSHPKARNKPFRGFVLKCI